jgi:hypothetical protein
VGLLERLRERLREWLERRRPKPTTPVSNILDDYDLQMLIQTELAAIRPNIRKLRKAIKETYIELGGSGQNARRIVQLVGTYWIERRLEQVDLPGPDALIKPKVIEMAQQFIGEAFDDFFAEPEV